MKDTRLVRDTRTELGMSFSFHLQSFGINLDFTRIKVNSSRLKVSFPLACCRTSKENRGVFVKLAKSYVVALTYTCYTSVIKYYTKTVVDDYDCHDNLLYVANNLRK